MTRASTYALLEPKPNASLPKACKLLASTPLQKAKSEHRGRHPTAPCHCSLLLRAAAASCSVPLQPPAPWRCSLLLRAAAASCSVPLQQPALAIVARALTRLLTRKHAVLLDIHYGKAAHTQALGPFPRTRGVPALRRPQACIRNVMPKLLLSLAQAVSCESPNITGAAAGLPSSATVYSFYSQTDGRQQCVHAAQRLNASQGVLPQSGTSAAAFTHRMRQSLTPSTFRSYSASNYAS